MAYRTKTPLPSEFGNGFDGDLHLTASGEMTQNEYNLTSLEIDAGVTWSCPKWSVNQEVFIPTIRCQTPIVLNGTISASEVCGCWLSGSGGFVDNNIDPGSGYMGTMAFLQAGGILGMGHILPIASGYCGNSEGNPPYYGDTGNVFPYAWTGLANLPAGHGWSNLYNANEDIAPAVGPHRLFRLCLGVGGGSFHDDATGAGGIGGGAIFIYAPGIIFGDNGTIEANGGNGTYSAGQGGGGGGAGGGYIEIHTQQNIAGSYAWGGQTVTATGDKAKCFASGGQGATGADPTYDGYDGMNGLVNFFQIGGN